MERVLELHPGFASAWVHLLWIDVFERDTAAARRKLEHLTDFSTPGGIAINPAEIRYYEAVVHAVTHGDAFTPQRLETDARFVAGLSDVLSPLQHGTGLLDMDQPRAQVQLDERLLELGVDAETEGAMRVGLMFSLAARGAWDSALVSAERAVDAADAGLLDEIPDLAIVAYGLAATGVHLGEVPDSAAAARREDAAAIATMGQASRRSPGSMESAPTTGVTRSP